MNANHQTKAETQTYKESRSRKFSFPRNSSFTNESVSDATENQNAQGYPSNCTVMFINNRCIDSQLDARSNGNEEIPFEGSHGNQGKGSYYNPGNESRLWRKLEADKMI